MININTQNKEIRRFKMNKNKYILFIISMILAIGILMPFGKVEARFDPLRIITTQKPPSAAAYIVQDMSGSMAFPINRLSDENYGAIGGTYWFGWRFNLSEGSTSYQQAMIASDYGVNVAGKGYPTKGVGQGYWLLDDYTTGYWDWYFVPPSRMAIVKNLMGPHINIYAPRDQWYPDDPQPPTLPAPLTDKATKKYYRFPVNQGPKNGAYFNWRTKQWVNYPNPNSSEPVPDPYYTKKFEPIRLIEKSSNVINWGLIIYNTRDGATQQVPINPQQDQTSTVKQMNDAMRPYPAGLGPYGGTPTSLAINRAKWELHESYKVDKLAECRRYVAILVTDGESNSCNPSDQTWGSACVNNPWNWYRYPPGRSDELFTRRIDSYTSCKTKDAVVQQNMQTFAIGLSQEVSRCELNMVAYMGRTDASRDDAGLSWSQNADRVPQNTSGQSNLSKFHPEDGDYAFFANTAEALKDAFEKIIDALSKGDFVVSAPVSVATFTKGSVLLSSTRIPGWLGGLRKWDMVEPDPDDLDKHKQPVLSTLCADLLDPNIIIYSGDPNPTDPKEKHFHLIWDAGCSLINLFDPVLPDHNRDIYTIDSRCNEGSASGPDNYCKASSGNMIKLQKDSSTINWIRSHITNVNWATIDLDGDNQTADIDDDDILILIDFILGGDGNNNVRSWLIGDIINAAPVVIGKPLPYSLGKYIPYKGSFDAINYNRKKIIYLPTNDGLLHALRFDHNPKDPTSPPIEEFAFLPPVNFPKVLQAYNNFKQFPDYPTGQAKGLDFDSHIWQISAIPTYADVWVNWYANGAGDWRTILFMPLGPKSEGMYALDVTDPTKSDPPFNVIWYWNGKNTSITAKEIWSSAPIGLSQLDGKVGNSYRKWFTAFSSTHESDVNQNNFFSIVRADTGQTLTTKTLAPINNALVPFHAYGNIAFMETDQPIYMPDALVTHAFGSDTAGRIPVIKLNSDNATSWNWNNPSYPLDFGNQQPIYYTPSVAHGVSTNAMLLSTAAGSIYESSEAMNGATTNYITRVSLDLLDIDQNTKDVKQNDPTKQHKHWDLAGSYPVDSDGDGQPDSTKVFSTLTRTTSRPLSSIIDGTTGAALYLVFDPIDYNPAYGVCTGKTYIFPVKFTLQSLSGPGGASAGFASVQTQPLWGVGYGVITGIAGGTEKILVGVTAYGEEGVAVPEFTPYEDPNPPSVLPRLRSVKRLQ